MNISTTILLVLFLMIMEYFFISKKINLHEYFNKRLYSDIDYHDINLSVKDKQKIKDGKKIAQNTSIVICFLTRDNNCEVKKNLNHYVHIGSQFKNYKIIAFENDSKDETRELLLQKTNKNKNIVLLNCCQLGNCDCKLKLIAANAHGALSNKRVDKMANFRNEYLNYVKNHYKDYDYLLVADVDAQGVLPCEGIFHTLSYDTWDAVISNGHSPLPGTFGLMTYTYDALAFMKDETDLHSWAKIIPKYVSMNSLIVLNNQCLIPVYSAFNGAALYKVESIINSHYSNFNTCEHNGLHKSMRDNGYDKIYINPFWKWYVGYQGERDPFKMIKNSFR